MSITFRFFSDNQFITKNHQYAQLLRKVLKNSRYLQAFLEQYRI